MWTWLTGRSRKVCDEVCDVMERTTPANGGDAAGLDSLLLQLAPVHRQHIASCEACRAFADDLAQVRAMLAAPESKPQPSPYFLTRVMASIADREAQLETKAQLWAAMPRQAYRLSVLASLTLLVACTWVYQMPKTSPVASARNAQLSVGLVDTGPVVDDALVSDTGR